MDTSDDRQLLEDCEREYEEAMDAIREDREKFWNSLSKDQQLKAFCAVVQRINNAEKEGRSYRGILYGEFGFGKEAYTQAQDAGFVQLHNAYFTKEDEAKLLTIFAQAEGIEDAENVVKRYIGDFDHA